MQKVDRAMISGGGQARTLKEKGFYLSGSPDNLRRNRDSLSPDVAGFKSGSK